MFEVTCSFVYMLVPLFIAESCEYMCSEKLLRYSDSLRAGWSEDRIPLEARFSTPAQTGPVAHAASCTCGYRVSFPGVKRPGRGVDHPLHLAPRLKKG